MPDRQAPVPVPRAGIWECPVAQQTRRIRIAAPVVSRQRGREGTARSWPQALTASPATYAADRYGAGTNSKRWYLIYHFRTFLTLSHFFQNDFKYFMDPPQWAIRPTHRTVRKPPSYPKLLDVNLILTQLGKYLVILDAGRRNNSCTGWSTVPIHTPANTKHLYDIFTTSDQRRRRWADVVQITLYKCYTNVLWLLGRAWSCLGGGTTPWQRLHIAPATAGTTPQGSLLSGLFAGPLPSRFIFYTITRGFKRH